MNYTREQAEEAKDIVKDVLKYYDVCMAGRKYKDFLDHKFPKKVSGWYKTEGSDKYLMYFDFENDIYYGFSSFGIWHSRDNSVDFESNSDYDYLATPQEVEQRLIKEANKRYKIGDVVKSCFSGWEKEIDDLDIYVDFKYELICNGISIFRYGKWAEVIEQPETELTRTIKKAEKIAAKLENLLSSQRS
jgi:hypothetical protein